MGRYNLHLGDCIEIMRTMEAESVDSVVTDPPYHLKSIVKRFGKEESAPAKFGNDGRHARLSAGFMGKAWDGGEIAQDPAMWAEVLRIAKPGAFLLAFGGTRTYHRMMVAIEDAGWEIRDCIMWVYASGFPKSHNLHGEREGWGTALKPAWEPIVVARKMVVGSVAENVLGFGTGAMNIDGCRVDVDPAVDDMQREVTRQKRESPTWDKGSGFKNENNPVTGVPANGRWPANLIHDGSEDVLALFPETAPSRVGKPRGTPKKGMFANSEFNKVGTEHDDSGSAARFYFCAKASKEDRDDGCEEMPLTERRTHGEMAPDESGDSHNTTGQHPAIGRNSHPTVKPTALMRYLVRLVTPPGGLIFDPFMGSGSTGKAAMIEGFNFEGCDKEAEYYGIAEKRIAHFASLGPLFEVAQEPAKTEQQKELEL